MERILTEAQKRGAKVVAVGDPEQLQAIEAGAAFRSMRQGRTATVIRAMQLETEMRSNPGLRADVFVQRWQALDKQRQSLLVYHENSRANRVAQTMIGMAKGLERDPQVESLLRGRKAQLGLPAGPERGVGQSLADMVGRGISRGLWIGM